MFSILNLSSRHCRLARKRLKNHLPFSIHLQYVPRDPPGGVPVATRRSQSKMHFEHKIRLLTRKLNFISRISKNWRNILPQYYAFLYYAHLNQLERKWEKFWTSYRFVYLQITLLILLKLKKSEINTEMRGSAFSHVLRLVIFFSYFSIRQCSWIQKK
jgi:hypothetical protein